MGYEGGTVFLNFVTPETDCGTVQRDIAAFGPPFTSALTPITAIDLASPAPLCLKSDFHINGVPIAKVLVVLVNRGQTDSAAEAFCAAWIGTPPQST
jgi:hypothetical protein